MLSERLKELRKINKVSQKQVAESIAINERNYRQYESGDVDPSSAKLKLIADFFNVSTDYLLGRSEIPNIEIDEISLIKKIDEVITTANELKDFIEKN